MNETILFLDQYGSKYGGAQQILIDIAEFLSEKSFKVSVALPDNQELAQNLLSKSIEVRFFDNFIDTSKYPYKSNLFYHFFWSIIHAIKLKKKYKYDDIKIIYCNGGRTFALGLFLSYFLNVNLIFHLHLVYNFNQRIYLNILGRFSKLRRVIVVSEFLKLQYKNLNIYHKIEVVNNWSNFQFDENKIKFKKSDLNNYKIIVVGRISDLKGQFHLLFCLRKIFFDFDLNIEFTFIGSCDDEKTKDKFNDIINTFENPFINVKYKGFIENVEDEISKYDFLLQPSLIYEAQSLAIIEAFTAKVIVISNNIFSNKDMIKHGVNGFIYESSIEESLEILFKEIYQKKYDLNYIIKNAYNDAKTLYCKQYQLKKIASLIEDEV